MMDRLLRESNPPTGQLASPKPQYKDVHTNNWEELKGEGGASYVKDKAVLAKLADLESELATIKANQLSGDQKVQLSGTNVVKQEVVLARGIYTETYRSVLDKPPEARGLHLFCRVFGRTGTFGSGEGLSLACVFNRGTSPAITTYGLEVITDISTDNYAGHHIFIGPDFVGLGDAKGEYANVKVSPMVLTTNLNFRLIISGTFEAGEGFDAEVTAVWVR